MEFLVLEVDGARFGIPTSDVREVVRAASLGASPRRFPNMTGVLNYRGQVLGVLELACLRQAGMRDMKPQDHLIILQSGAHAFAVRVDKAVEIMIWNEAAAAGGQPANNDVSLDALNPISHPRLGVVYLLDASSLWTELHREPSRQPAQEVEGI